MEPKQTTRKKVKDELNEVKAKLADFKLEAAMEIASAKKRVTNRDFYQGMVYGAGGALLIIGLFYIIF